MNTAVSRPIGSREGRPTVSAPPQVATRTPARLDGPRYEVRLGTGAVRRYASTGDLKNDLLSGAITRSNDCREVYLEPTEEDFADQGVGAAEQYASSHADWVTKSSWRPIGKGLAVESNEIKRLYHPFAASVETGADVGWWLSFGVASLPLLAVAACWAADWQPGSLPTARPFTPGVVGAGAMLQMISSVPGGAFAVRLTCAVPLALMAAGASALITGLPAGAAVGAVIYACQRKSLPRPPHDGFTDPQADRARSWRLVGLFALGIPALAMAVFMLSVVAALKHNPDAAAPAESAPKERTAAGPRVTPEKAGEPGAGTASPTPAVESMWDTYSDPTGRFTCRVPPGWETDEDRQDLRSKVRFFQGGNEIRVITRDTSRHVLDESHRREMMAVMERNVKAIRGQGGVAALRSVGWRAMEGERGLQVDIDVKAPPVVQRQVKYKKGGWDHCVGLYAQETARREELLGLFERFLSVLCPRQGPAAAGASGEAAR
jgi:hypothetical protein